MKPRDRVDIRLLTSRSAIAMQRSVVIHTFREVLGLRLERHEADVLQYYGRVSLALFDFLEFCGCPGYKTGLLPLEIELEFFLPGAEKRLFESRMGVGIDEDIKKLRPHIGHMSSIWLGVKQRLLRWRWIRQDDSGQDSLTARHSDGYESFLELVDDTMRKCNEIHQWGATMILAFKIHRKALRILTEVTLDVKGQADELLFGFALGKLQKNFSGLNTT